MTTTKTRKFKAHEQHLVNTVLRQAGTLWKAILEGVMNSADAGATKCDISLSAGMVVIQDDGRGFKTEKEIEDHFETFGTPHKEGDATYGEFRMGRGQMMAFGANDWQTDKFHMLVDIKKNGLDYQLFHLKKPVPGCRIEIKLYEKLLPSELLGAEEELKKFVRYVSIPVTLNGTVISTDPKKEKWDYNLDGAYLRLRENMSELRVYNLGVFVCGIPAGDVGCGGVLVSKQKLKLNFARNDVMRAGSQKCPVWAKVAPLMKKTISEAVARKPSLTGPAKMSLLRQWLNGESPVNAANLPLFQSTTGRWYSLKQLLKVRQEFPAVCQGNKMDFRADKVMQMKLGFAICRSTLELADCVKLSDFLPKLQKMAEQVRLLHDYSGKNSRFDTWPIRTLEQLDGKLDKHYQLLQDEELTPYELTVLNTIRKSTKWLAGRMDRTDRRIVMGISKHANGWTDGTTYIAINRDYVKRFNGDLGLWVQLGFLLTHEYCHDEESHATHQHTPEFYEAFHDAVRGGHYDGGFIRNFVSRAEYHFPLELQATKAKMSSRIAKQLDSTAKLKAAHEQTAPRQAASV